MFDLYAITYLTVMFVVGVICLLRVFVNDDTLRLSVWSIMLLAWIGTTASQLVSVSYVPVGLFLLVDFVTAITLGLVALAYKKLWIWWIGAMHAGILGLNALYVLGGQLNAFAFLTAMSLLSFVALIIITDITTLPQLISRGLRNGFTSLDSRSVGFSNSNRVSSRGPQRYR